jgi:hypothetical protein
MGIFGDGGQEAVTGQVVLVISDTTVLRMEGARLAGVGPGRSSVRARFEEIEGVAEVRVVSAKTAPISPGSRQVPGGLASSGASPVRDTVSVGAGYRLRAQALPGISLSWTVVEGPAWLVVDTETGDLVGSPPDEGTYEVVLAGEDSTGQAALVVVTLTARGKVEAGEVPGAGSSEPDPGAQGEGGGIVLSPNAPNPFNGTTVFRCRSPTPGRVEVYTLLGHCVRRWAVVGVGQTALVWDGRDGSGKALPSGVYFLVFEAGGVRMTRRMALIR